MRGKMNMELKGLKIVLHSTESEYLIINLPWLIGSFGKVSVPAKITQTLT